MAFLGIGALLVMLFLLGTVVAIIAAIGMAIAHGRFGLALAIGSGAFLMLIILLGFAAAITVPMYERHATVTATMNTAVESTPGPQFTVSGIPQSSVSFASQPRWRIGAFPALFLIVAIIFVLARSAKHHFAHAGATSRAFRWPVFIAIPILAVLVIGGFRFQAKHSENAISQADEINESIRLQAETFAQQQQALAKHAAETNADMNEKFRVQTEAFVKQQQALIKRATELSTDLHKRIDKMDIQQLMDEFDAPRIMLQAPLTAPAAWIMAATPKALGPVSTSTDATLANTTGKTKEHSSSKSKAHTSKTPSTTTVAKLNQSPAIPEPPTPPSPATAVAPPAAPAPQATAATSESDSSIGQANTDEAAADQTSSADNHSVKTASKKQQPTDSLSAGKPAWINKPPKRTGPIRREVIQTDPYVTAEECYQAIDVYLLFRTYEHLQELANQPVLATDLPSITFQKGMTMADGKLIAVGDKNRQWVDWRPQYLNALGISLDYIHRELIAKDSTNNESCEYLDTVESSNGPMKKLYMELAFTPAIDRDLIQKLDAYARRGKFKLVGVSSAGVFALLFTVWGLLKVDTATKGYYSKWLFVGVPAAIIGTTLLSVLVIR
jgi:hypothetical protein